MKVKRPIIFTAILLFCLIGFVIYSANKNKNEEVIDITDVNTIASNDEIQNDSKGIKKAVSPSGFPGAARHKLILYNNGDVHLTTYDGIVYSEENIKIDELIAQNATDIIQNEEAETIVVKGSNIYIANSKYSWIEFKDE